MIKFFIENASQIMAEARSQASQALREMEEAIAFEGTSKKKREQAIRGKEKFQTMIDLL